MLKLSFEKKLNKLYLGFKVLIKAKLGVDGQGALTLFSLAGWRQADP